MKNVNYHNENLCSIAGFENTFFGESIIREILGKLFQKTNIVIAEIQRPYYEPELLKKSIIDISSEVENLKIDEDWFSISFDYHAKEDNDKFIELFIDIWFGYEQPTFSFFVTAQEKKSYQNLIIGNRMSWRDITDISSSYVLCKGIEEDVMWIGKSKNLKFNDIIIT